MTFSEALVPNEVEVTLLIHAKGDYDASDLHIYTVRWNGGSLDEQVVVDHPNIRPLGPAVTLASLVFRYGHNGDSNSTEPYYPLSQEPGRGAYRVISHSALTKLFGSC